MSNYPLTPPIPLTPEEKVKGIGWKLRILPEDSDERTATGAVSDEFRFRDGVNRFWYPSCMRLGPRCRFAREWISTSAPGRRTGPSPWSRHRSMFKHASR